MEYRQRCYQAYVEHWKKLNACSQEEFDRNAKLFKALFQNFLPAQKTARIVDVACGTGHFLYFLKKEGYTNVCGVDISDVQLDIARNMGVGEVENRDLFTYLPNFSNEFDMIMASDIIEHLQKAEVLHLLDLMRAALRPGGSAIIRTLNAYAVTPYADFTHEQGFTCISLEQVLGVCGFRDIKTYGEGPVVYDSKSFARTVAWRGTKAFVKLFYMVRDGTGRGLSSQRVVLEPRIFAVAKK